MKVIVLLAVLGLIYLFAGCLAKTMGLETPGPEDECGCDKGSCTTKNDVSRNN